MIKDMKIFVDGQEIKFPFDLNNLFAQMPKGFCLPQNLLRMPQDFGQPRDIQRPLRLPMRLVKEEITPKEGERQVKTVWYNVDIRKDLETLHERVKRLEELFIKKELKKPVKTKPKTKGVSKTKGKLKKMVKDSKNKKK